MDICCMNILVIQVVPLDLRVCTETNSPSGFEAMYLAMIRKYSDSVILVKGYACRKSFSPVSPKLFNETHRKG